MDKDIGWGLESIDEAFDRFINMAKQIASRNKRYYEFEDAFQAAAEGFTKAFYKYDKSKNYRFSTLAYDYMKGHVISLRRTNELVHFSESSKELAVKIRNDDMLEAPIEDIKTKYNVTAQSVRKAFESMKQGKSLNEKIEDSGTQAERLDLIGQSEDFTGLIVDDFKNCLTESQRNSLEWLLQGYLMREAARDDGVSDQRVQQRMVQVRKRWRDYTQNGSLEGAN